MGPFQQVSATFLVCLPRGAAPWIARRRPPPEITELLQEVRHDRFRNLFDEGLARVGIDFVAAGEPTGVRRIDDLHRERELPATQPEIPFHEQAHAERVRDLRQ